MSRICIIEDDASVRSSLAFALGIEGHDVASFSSGEDALASPAPADCACLVIDYRLPGMNGVALLDRIRDRGIATPAVFITSNPTPQLVAEIAATKSSLVEKPLLQDYLVRAVAAATER